MLMLGDEEQKHGHSKVFLRSFCRQAAASKIRGAAATTRNSPRPDRQNPRRHYHKQPVCRRARTRGPQLVRANSVRAQSPPLARHGRRRPASSLPVCRRFQAPVRIKCVVGVHHGRRPAADRGIHSSQHVLPIRAGGPPVV